MISAMVFETLRQLARVASPRVSHPDCRHVARGRPAENNPLTIRRFAGAKVPGSGFRLGKPRHRAITRIEPADLCATPRQFRLVVTVKMVGVGPLRLELPRDFRTRQTAWKENGPVACPRHQVGA